MSNFFQENNLEIKKQGSLWIVNGIKMLFLTETSKVLVNGEINLSEAQLQMFFVNGSAEAVAIIPAETPYYAMFNKEAGKFEDLKIMLFDNKLKNPSKTPLLGIKSKYSMMESSINLKSVVNIAKKTGITALGVCDTNCMGGVLEFQEHCLGAGIKPVLGLQCDVDFGNNDKFPLKFYGTYQELLKLNKIAFVDNYKTNCITKEQLKKLSTSVTIVVNPDKVPFNVELLNYLESHFNKVYYQFSTNEYQSSSIYSKFLNRLKEYVNSSYEPIWINDTYNTHRFYKNSRTLLGKLVTGLNPKRSENLEMKTCKTSKEEIMFALNDETEKVFDRAVRNVQVLVDSLPDKPIITDGFKIPKFLPTKEEEYEAFRNCIGEGWKSKIANNPRLDQKVYADRVKTEMEVITSSNYVSYFLITKSQYEYADSIGAYYGRGRGSGAGSLVTYLMGITDVDPIKHGLSFSRFLNKGRATKSMPDLDCDFERRYVNMIKGFLMSRYGEKNVALIGNFGELTAKTALTRLMKLHGEQDKIIKYHTKMIGNNDGDTMLNVMLNTSPRLTTFLNKNYDACSKVELVEGALIQKGVHACGVLITPEEDFDGNPTEIHDYIPCRKIKYQDFPEPVLITEFNGKNCEKMGLLKNDILSLGTLDDIHDIIDLIQEKKSTTIDYKNIPVDCKESFNNFAEGKTCKVFQFSSTVATQYVKRAKPSSISDLSIATSLLRPATMNLKIHEHYLDVKNEIREAEYDLLLEDVEEETLGFLVYQEQVMKAFVVLADFTDAQADDVRKAIGKKDMEKMKTFKVMFTEESTKKGYTTSMADELWDKIVEFSTYSFNKAHAFSYAWLSNDTMWLKTHFPAEFYSIALATEYKKAKAVRDMASIIKEIQEEGIISVKTPDINLAPEVFDIVGNDIYWGLSQIKQVKTLASSIIKERDENGNFLSIVDFDNRTKAKKNEVENLILSGAFDEVEFVKDVFDRAKVLMKFYENRATKEKDRKYINCSFIEYKSYESDILGWTYIDYDKLIDKASLPIDDYFKSSELQGLDEGDEITLAGSIKVATLKKNAYGDMLSITLESNSDLVYVTGFSSFLKKNKDDTKRIKKGCYLFLSGIVKDDKYKQCKTLSLNHNSKITFIYENIKE